MAKIKVKTNIDIERNPVERILMKIAEILKANRKLVLYIFGAIFLGLILTIVASVIVDMRSTDQQIRYEAIMDEYYKNRKDTKIVEKTIAELQKLADSAYIGFASKMPYYMMGNLYYDLKKFKEARKYLLIFANKDSSEVFTPLAFLKAALSLEEMGKLDDALVSLKKLQEKYGEGMVADQVLYNIGRIYSIKGDPAQAKIYFNRVIAQFPQSVLAGRAKQRLILTEVQKAKTE